MFCPTCGRQNADNAKFCDGCGTSLNGAAQPSQPAQAAAFTPAPPPPSPAQPQYAPPPPAYYPPQQYVANDLTKPMTIGNYIGFFLLQLIPIANIILLFVWAFGSAVNINKKNLARTLLIFAAISIVLSIIMGGVMVNVMRDLMDELGGYGWR
jgi:hypothetical protein